jgi:hypothetical protein
MSSHWIYIAMQNCGTEEREARARECRNTPRLRVRDLATRDKSQGGRWRDANGRPIRHVSLS